VKKTGETSPLRLDTAIEDGGIVGEIEDEVEFHEFVNLIVTDRPKGASNQFKLGEKVTIGLDFEKLGEKFDYRLNRCWASSDNNDGNVDISN
jgi:hypothetical protein